MLDDQTDTTTTAPADAPADAAAGPAPSGDAPAAEAPPARTPRKRAPRKTAAKKTAAPPPPEEPSSPEAVTAPDPTAAVDAASAPAAAEPPAHQPPAKKTTRTRKTAAKKATPPPSSSEPGAAAEPNAEGIAPAQAVSAPGLSALPEEPTRAGDPGVADTAPQSSDAGAGAPALLFQAPEPTPAPAKRAPRKRAAKKAAAAPAPEAAPADTESTAAPESVVAARPAAEPEAPAEPAATSDIAVEDDAPADVDAAVDAAIDAESVDAASVDAVDAESVDAESLDVEPVDPSESGPDDADDAEDSGDTEDTDEADETDESEDSEDGEREGGARRRRRRGGRRRRKGGDKGEDKSEDKGGESAAADGAAPDTVAATAGETPDEAAAVPDAGDDAEKSDGDKAEGGTSRRRRRRRRSGEGEDSPSGDDPENTVTRVRKSRSAEDEITGFNGSTRLEAKKQRRREGREAGRRRAPIISEAEFLARRESVERSMVIRQQGELTQIAVLEDKVLVEHYVARESQTSLMGNVYLGRVQNVLPSMEAAFVDIGKGRNAVLYAGEVNWDSFGVKDGQRKIEQVLKTGQTLLVQVTKDPVGHKGARLTSQVSLPGRFLVYVPDGTTSGISRKLPENERNRLKTLLKEIVPEGAGVIVRTAAEGASEEELTRDVERLKARWEEISAKVASGNAPQLLYGEPDLTLKVVRDLFTEDFSKLVISGDQAWELVEGYVSQVAPDLQPRMERHDDSGGDAFTDLRIDEQIAKALDRKVWLPSGGSLVIDRTEAMTVVDVNTGKFTGSGGNLEETVTKNNLEAAEEIVRQLRLRDIGGIIVIDFIDMVLESNRDLVLRRLVECLGRDRTRHQVAEVTSLGLVQMTRKRIGTGLLEAFSEPCECCQGRGIHVQSQPVEDKGRSDEDQPSRGGRGSRSGRRGRGEDRAKDEAPSKAPAPEAVPTPHKRPTPAEFAAMAGAEAGSGAGTVEGEAPERRPDDQQPDQQPDLQSDQQPEQPEQPAEEKVEQPAEAVEVAEAAPVPPPAPRLVTTVRRRGARRPAGPPVANGSDPVDRASGDGVPVDVPAEQ